MHVFLPSSSSFNQVPTVIGIFTFVAHVNVILLNLLGFLSDSTGLGYQTSYAERLCIWPYFHVYFTLYIVRGMYGLEAFRPTVVFIYFVPSLSSTSLCLHSLLTRNEKGRSSRATHSPSQLSFVSPCFLSCVAVFAPWHWQKPSHAPSPTFLLLAFHYYTEYPRHWNIRSCNSHKNGFPLPASFQHFYCLFWFLFFSLPHCLVMTSINKSHSCASSFPSCNCVHFSPFAVFLRYGFHFATGEVQKKPLDH